MANQGQPGQPGHPGNGHRLSELKLRLPESISGGTYANSMVIQHSVHEFILDFALVTGGNGQIVSRVITSPGHMKLIAKAIDENIQKYEDMYGPIPQPRQP